MNLMDSVSPNHQKMIQSKFLRSILIKSDFLLGNRVNAKGLLEYQLKQARLASLFNLKKPLGYKTSPHKDLFDLTNVITRDSEIMHTIPEDRICSQFERDISNMYFVSLG